MADAIVSAAAGRLVGLIEEQALFHINLVRGAEEEVHSLADVLNRIKYVLDDAENRRFKDKNINYWLSKLEQVSCEMEDVLDQWDYAILKHQSGDAVVAPLEQKVSSLIPSCSCLCFKKLVVRHEIATKILNVKSQLDEISKEKDQYNFVVSQPDPCQPSPVSWRDSSTSITVVEEVRGRGIDSDILVAKLISDGSSIQTVSIVGVGGLGKTTIAQLVYNNSRLKGHFELRIWVCVSHPFDLISIAKGIIESLKGNSPSTYKLETLWQYVADFISGKKFLLVLDDVWTEEYSKWERLESYLRCGGKGSKILVTTRKTNVARIMGTMKEDIHNPEMLSVEDCWLLMRHIACLERADLNFEDIGKKIAKKCNGLPLAARTLGSLLRNKSRLEEWKVVLNHDVWEMKEAEVELFPHLLLSYNELSTTLKRCFTYCIVFPKNFRIDVGELIQNWMAIGFLGNDSDDIENRGREYFDILAMHSLFQEIDENEFTGKISCKMHDIVHDFAQFLRKSGRVWVTRKVICTTCRDHDPSQISTVIESRSLIWNDKDSPPNLCDCLTSLRVLSLRWCSLQRIPQIIEKFIHLRLLDLHGNKLLIDDLLIIFKLYNLKTLNIGSCSITEIPKEIGNLINLRHLNLSRNISLKHLPREIEKLIHLRSLDLQENKSLNELPREIGSLINLTHLDLSVNYSRKVLPTEIWNLNHLTHLDISQNDCLLQLPREIGKLINLTHLNLSGLYSLRDLPQEIGKLIHLRHLKLIGNKCLERLPMTFYRLCELQILDVRYCEILCEVPDGLFALRYISSLVELKGKSTWSIFGLLEDINHIGERVRLVIKLDNDDDKERVVNDARKAELRNKMYIEELEIMFEDEKEEEDSSTNNKVRMDLMDALEPPPNLQRLTISKYKGTKLPGWMASPLDQLRDVYLIQCHNLTAFPSLGKLPCLERIFIDHMEELEMVGREFLNLDECSSNTTSVIISFPRLRELSIIGCGKWKEWEDISAEEEEDAALSVMPRLEELKILSCNALMALPHRLLRKVSSLKVLNISDSTQLQQRYGDKDGSDWKSISQNNPSLQLKG